MDRTAPDVPSSFVALMSKRPAIHAVTRYALDAAVWPDVRPLADVGDLVLVPSPVIVLLDLDGLPPNVGFDQVRASRPDASIVALAGATSGAAVLGALRAGVRAYVRTPDDLATLGDVLGRVARGEVVVRLDMQRAAVEELGRLVRRVREGAGVQTQLTPRERQILVLLADGLTARQIGTRLSISPRTVERHAHGLYRKLDVRTRVQAVARAASIGLVDVR